MYSYLRIAGMLWLMSGMAAMGQTPADTTDTQQLHDVTVTARQSGTLRMGGAENGIKIGKAELFKAACCNLGESFTTNPSVDVNYSDAATGAKQIKLLGLSGTYVQMLTENLPNFRGAATPYALDYVPGPWMQSIQVSKGASSVRNGHESMTGQIDIEYLKPDTEQGATVNLYGNTLSRFEANADGNVHLGEALSTEILAHYQNDRGHHDENSDGFLDQPNVKQWNLQNRWKLRTDKYLFHAGAGLLKEKRSGGQLHGAAAASQHGELFKTAVETDRYEGYMKHAFILDAERGTNVALMASGSLHETEALFGHKTYHVNERNAYMQLLFETNFTDSHSLSTGFSFNHDYFDEKVNVEAPLSFIPKENTAGAYAQYTYNLHNKVVAMAGLRIDHSDVYGAFLTPRLHLKWTPHDIVTLRLSAGKGYRTVHALAENTYLLASGRQMVVDDLRQEEAWNYGISGAFYIPMFGKTLKLNAEYYHTHFAQQAVVDYDTDPTLLRITNLSGRSYSNTCQVDATYALLQHLDMTLAYRYNDVKTTYGGKLMEKPFTSRYKALLTLSWKTPLELWQVDATLQLNGGGRLPVSPLSEPQTNVLHSWSEGRFHSYEQLNLQVTRWFRHFSVYAGGENITGFHQKQTVLNAHDPWGASFDPTQVWGPVHGALAYVGIRINIGRL